MRKIINEEEFIKQSKEIHGDKYDYSLVKYVNKNTKVDIICNDHIFSQIPKSHLKGHCCPICTNVVKSTTEEFIKKSIIIHGNKYDYSLVKYINAKTPIKIKCIKHDYIFEQSPNTHLRNHGCPKCYGNERKTNDIFIKQSKEIHGDKYDYSLVNYINNGTKVKIRCIEHNFIFEQIPNKHLHYNGCPICSSKIRSNINNSNTEEFIKKSKEVHGDKYDYSLVNYNGCFNKVSILCKEHNMIFKQTPDSHINGIGCPKCGLLVRSDKLRSNKEEFIIKSKEIHGDKYDYNLVEYISASKKVKIKCIKHDTIFEQIPNSHLLGCGCSKCFSSKGENKIRTFLDNEKIIYKEQYQFIDCRNILPLKFDFYLPKYNMCIEYDGEQHFRRYRFEINDDKLLFRQKMDNIKNIYCKEKSIKLLRIKYTKLNKITDILKNEIKNNKLN